MSYDIRPKLICTQNLLVQAAITGFNYLNPVALNNIGWKYYIAICCIIAVQIAVVYFTYPETSKITLEEVSIVFDGKKAIGSDLMQKLETDLDGANVTDDKENVTVERREVHNDT